jgi:hypothetical protein
VFAQLMALANKTSLLDARSVVFAIRTVPFHYLAG